MTDHIRQFEAATLKHLPAAYNLARWLLRDEQQAQDAVQEAYLNAFGRFEHLRSDNARPWLLAIVRNACHDCQRRQRHLIDQVQFDELRDSSPDGPGPASSPPAMADPAMLWEQQARVARVNAAIGALAPLFREVIVLRELEEMSYEEIARVVAIPIGTVMSRLSRARALLRDALQGDLPNAAAGRRRDANT